MDPGEQQSSSSPAPWSEEEIQPLINLRADMHATFVSANSIGKQGLWDEIERRFAALSGHQRSPHELEAKFEQYKRRKVFKEALQRRKYSRARRTVADRQILDDDQSAHTEAERKKVHEELDLNTPPPADQQKPGEQSARMEAARKRIREVLNLKAFFSQENSWRDAIVLLKQGLDTEESCY